MSSKSISSSVDFLFEINPPKDDRSSGPPYFKIASVVALVVSAFFALAIIPGAIGIMGYATGAPAFTVVVLNVLTPAGVITFTLEGGAGLLGILGSMVVLVFAFSKKSPPPEKEPPLKLDKEEVEKNPDKPPPSRRRPVVKKEKEIEIHKIDSSSDESSTEEVSLRDDSNHYVYEALEKLKNKDGVVPHIVCVNEDPLDMDVDDYFICHIDCPDSYVVHIQTGDFDGEFGGVEYADFKTLRETQAFIRHIKKPISLEPFTDLADLKAKAKSTKSKQYRIFTKEGDDSNILYVLFKVRGKLCFTTCDNAYETKCFIYHHPKTGLEGRAITYVSIHAKEDVSPLASLSL